MQKQRGHEGGSERVAMGGAQGGVLGIESGARREQGLGKGNIKER